jgi:RNA polymerase sigma factor (sigma-70 family)
LAESLLKRIAAGDRKAVQECIDTYSGLVWSIARRLSNTPTDADDAVQEVFVNIWENADRFDESIGSETTFVAMIARRRLIDRRRRQQRRPDQVSPVSDSQIQMADPRQDDPSAGTRDEAARAMAALEQLRPEQREVLQLSIIHGRTYEQIAASTGKPVGTVKTHARRGLMRLREMLQTSQPGDTEVSR